MNLTPKFNCREAEIGNLMSVQLRLFSCIHNLCIPLIELNRSHCIIVSGQTLFYLNLNENAAETGRKKMFGVHFICWIFRMSPNEKDGTLSNRFGNMTFTVVSFYHCWKEFDSILKLWSDRIDHFEIVT